MNITKHMRQRMQQRCISMPMIQHLMEEGDVSTDEKIFLNLNNLKQSISEIDYVINILNHRKNALEKIKKRGGLIVVTDAETAITTYTYQ